MSDSNRVIYLKHHFEYMGVSTPWFWEWNEWIRDYDALKAKGLSWGAVQNEFVKMGRDQTQAATFVAGMKLIETQGGVQDPNERPSWSESYDMGLKPFADAVPWKTIIVVALAYGFVTQGLPKILIAKGANAGR